ncbi:hypothetical protein [Streptomyces sp. NPDC088789]|uniref:hypothetical protein n=1 Tax=Streptomyces sp. NPDC088789 TaxID=3365899 RepID=UPI00381E906F
MTSADELRAAATTLRALATTASTASRDKPTSRWHFKTRDSRSGYLYSANPDGPGMRLTPEGMHPRHGQYAATMDPTLGLALADWLDTAAHHYECGIRAADDVFRDDPDGRDAFLTTGPGAPSPQALAVARQINGSQQ